MANKFKIDATETVLVVIDVQERLSTAMPEDVVEAMIDQAAVLMDAAEVLQLPVIVMEQYPTGLGCTVAALEERVVKTGIEKINKVSFSCCGEPAFISALEESGCKTVILCGQETHVCVLQTALDLIEQDYRVFIAADAICSRAAANWQFALDEMRQAGCVVEPVESMLFKMLGVAGTTEFKAISRLVK